MAAPPEPSSPPWTTAASATPRPPPTPPCSVSSPCSPAPPPSWSRPARSSSPPPWRDFLNQIVPPGTEDLVVQQFRVMGERPAGFLIGAGVVSLWAASGVIKSLIEGFQAAYRVPRNRDFFRQSGVAMSLVLLSAVPLVCASLLHRLRRPGGARRPQLDEGRSLPHPVRLGLAGRQPRRPLRPRLRHHHHRDVIALLLRPLPQTALAIRLARRHPGHRPVVLRHPGVRLVRAQSRPLQRDVRLHRRRHRAAGLDVSDRPDRPDRLRVQCHRTSARPDSSDCFSRRTSQAGIRYNLC